MRAKIPTKIAGVTYFATSSQGLKLMSFDLRADDPGSAFRSSMTDWACEAAENSARAPRIPEANRIRAKAPLTYSLNWAISGVVSAAKASRPVGANWAIMR